MTNLDTWFQQIEKMGQADIPMEFNGVWMTPREYYNRNKR